MVIKIPGTQRSAQSHHMAELLGLGSKGKIPKEGLPPRIIQGVKVWADPIQPGVFRIRLRCECPVCGVNVPVGRLDQHFKVHR